jgi:hypothetical protein
MLDSEDPMFIIQYPASLGKKPKKPIGTISATGDKR